MGGEGKGEEGERRGGEGGLPKSPPLKNPRSAIVAMPTSLK